MRFALGLLVVTLSSTATAFAEESLEDRVRRLDQEPTSAAPATNIWGRPAVEYGPDVPGVRPSAESAPSNPDVSSLGDMLGKNQGAMGGLIDQNGVVDKKMGAAAYENYRGMVDGFIKQNMGR